MTISTLVEVKKLQVTSNPMSMAAVVAAISRPTKEQYMKELAIGNAGLMLLLSVIVDPEGALMPPE
jgi:hypothetical protein